MTTAFTGCSGLADIIANGARKRKSMNDQAASAAEVVSKAKAAEAKAAKKEAKGKGNGKAKAAIKYGTGKANAPKACWACLSVQKSWATSVMSYPTNK